MYTRYRGYILQGQAARPGWQVRIRPSRPGVPILSRGSVDAPTLDDAIAEAERRIDRLLWEARIRA
ncbi:hypothetical protein AUC71_07635 [Methyloceanibacter marginalis]|jgi:hypothetical protein|uniref:Integrase DNA-binding domain-containing protein n=1 Tax=Methyloceanibacter marginalis TaxID=1774971 RepID=A0A1E3WDB8_9HYPH|nr:hypothetical protein [Methyloceanibacter marginalis]ODS03798.1 hypothetical protein AUC71_07635 [Methyloceanibacter marginalis]